MTFMSKVYKFGPFHMRGKFLLRGEKVVRITPKQFEILFFLVENRERSIGGNEILEKFWPVSQDEDTNPKYVELNNVTQNISDLRKALDDTPQEHKYIKTIGSSYRFVAKDLEMIDEGDSFNERLSLAQGEEIVEQQSAVNINSGEYFPSQGNEDAATIVQSRSAALTPDDSKDEEITFRELWRSADRVVQWLILAGIFVTATLTIAGVVFNLPKTKLYVSIPQLFLLLGAACYIPSGPTKLSHTTKEIDEESRDIAEEALRRYRIYWRLIWSTWVFLYFCLLFIDPTKKEREQVVTICTILFNNLNTAVLILCYNMLNQSVEIEKGRRKINDNSWIGWGAGLVGTYLLIEILIMVLVSGVDEREVPIYGLSLVSGIAGGIGMALYVGRLQSKFLGPSPLLVIALYSYTAIQSLFIFLVGFPKGKQVFTEPTELLIAVALINIALILKSLLYLYMAKLFKSGDLLFYFVKVRHTYLNVSQERRGFRKFFKQQS